MISEISDEATVDTTLTTITNQLGFERFAYLSCQFDWALAVSDYAKDWQKRYFQAQFEKIDPIVAIAKLRMLPFAWSGSRDILQDGEEVTRFWGEAAEFGIRSGITIPIKTAFGHVSMLTLASSIPDAVTDDDFDPLAAINVVKQLQAQIETLRVLPTAKTAFHLTEKEIDYLGWIAQGKTMEETAAIMEVKYNSVRITIENAKKRCGAVTTVQLVALAVRHGLI